MDGIINVLKPPGMTSHDVVSFIRKKLKISRVGHTGTLDPGVPGVLPICIGKATRISEYLTGGTKSYRGIIRFGEKTDTQDSFGEVISSQEASFLTKDVIAECFRRFTGTQEQVPPMVSAVKVRGKRLYELARAGQEIPRQRRTILIYSLDIIRFSNIGDKHPEVMFDVTCSKGTYIRTLCHDIGEALGCGAHMSFLVRTASGPYNLRESYTLEEISELAQNQKIHKVILPIDSALQEMPVLLVKKGAEKAVCNGSRLYPQGVEFVEERVSEGTLVRIKNNEGHLLAIGEARTEETGEGNRQVYQPVKVFC